MLTIELNMYHAVALGAFLFWLGGVHVSYPAEEIDTMGNMFLSIFLAMALAASSSGSSSTLQCRWSSALCSSVL